jgi:EAL domain-containing protein (putative c-di-GMP-specific phosphodiesterase class I)
LRGVVDALRRPDSFRAVKQAILSLADEAVVGWEFLSRGPAGSFEMPGDFLRVALERNILTLVDLNCLRSCLQAARGLPDDMLRHVNLFPSTLLDMPQERLVELFPSDRGRNRFCVEVSEQQFIGDPACLRAPVRALKDAGIRVAIDDVGYGRSSLESLILLEPDVVKIDQKVVKGAARDQVQERSLRRLVALVRAVGCELVAEGIESREDLDLLRALGVPHGQGFLWGEPA